MRVRRRSGYTLVELVVGMSILALVMLGTMSIYVLGVRSFNRVDTDLKIAQDNAIGVRKVTEALREAVSIQISLGGNSITYFLPKLSDEEDETTGEYEYVEPIVSDGIARTFSVTSSGKLVDSETGRVLIRDLYAKDPDPKSSQYNKLYAPFSLTTIGSRRAVTVNFITRAEAGASERYKRMKSTVIIRNSP
ncbi:MAG: hypothetical protein HONBIEJF_00251 [Fimbriimonadaceae bacterium]|nr:hypothetical protein [Fimbriimonadaceae bacterium]